MPLFSFRTSVRDQRESLSARAIHANDFFEKWDVVSTARARMSAQLLQRKGGGRRERLCGRQSKNLFNRPFDRKLAKLHLAAQIPRREEGSTQTMLSLTHSIKLSSLDLPVLFARVFPLCSFPFSPSLFLFRGKMTSCHDSRFYLKKGRDTGHDMMTD